ncbi:MAG: ADP compounds hydrolase NudE [Gammaproteobacteria bacterium]|nr:ADP compounds hydrolase NudE [Gammaproteobacteria bacterium]MBU1724264.1 ADP compounds hydrolase NudE [Gammaproteobacteria bacterium]MBU2006308.1 ADP compounds hydrolase NudE [Gammaproteobacteria bacterium]
MSKLPTIHETRHVASSRLFQVEEVHLEFSNGERRIFERLVSRGYGAVLVVPMLDDETVLMIREYAVGTERYELGLPKGKVEPGEDILLAANREIMEEVGYGAEDIQLLKAVTLAPGYMGHHTHLLVARGLYPARLEGDEPEQLEVVPWKLADLPQLIAGNECTEGRSLLALFLLRDWLKTPHPPAPSPAKR